MTEYICEPIRDFEWDSGYECGYIRKGELIRCKDCKFYKPQFNEDGYYTTNCQYSKVAEVNGFCHMARRKEE